MRITKVGRALLGAVAAAAMALGATGCATTQPGTGSSGGSSSAAPKIQVLAAENHYGDVAQQIGGDYVTVTSILTDPSVDPHNFEAQPSDAKLLDSAQIVISNGLGYDAWLDTMLTAHPNPDRTVINAQAVLGLPDDTKNPHLWYDPKTMPAVAQSLAAALEKLDPSHTSTYQQNLTQFGTSMSQYTSALTTFKQQHPSASVAATEPVANYLLDGAAITIKTPWTLQDSIMNGQDPSAQDTATQMALLSGKQVDAFVYNEQVVSSLTQKYLDAANASGVPVVAAYETMPPNYHYVEWMTAEVNALDKALTQKQSTNSL